MRRVEHILTRIRQETDNEQIGTDQGISDNEIIGYLNDGQDDIYGGIATVFRSAFAAESSFPCVGGQETYDAPTDAYMDGQAIVLEYSQSGQDDGYTALKRVTMRERMTISGVPSRYTVANGKVYVWPIPQASQGTFRLVYSKVVPTLDKKRAVVNSVTKVGNDVTGITLLAANGLPFSVQDEIEFSKSDYLCASDFYGNVLATRIPYTAVTLVGGLGIVTIKGGAHTMSAGENIQSGDFVTLGEYSTTVSKLPDNCEQYLTAYGSMKVFVRDSNNLAGIKAQEVGAMRANILDNYAELSADVDHIPNINSDDDGWW